MKTNESVQNNVEAVEVTSQNNEGKAVKSFNTVLKAAVTAQSKANVSWHKAQQHAVQIAALYRNLTPLSELFQAAHESKAVRSTELLSFVQYLASPLHDGNDCVVTWDSKKLTFGLKKGKELPADAVELSNTQAWFEWAKPAKTSLPTFKALLAALKKAASANERGELTVKSANEIKALNAMLEAVRSNLGSDAV